MIRYIALQVSYAGVAQLAEQLICNQQVGGSIPFTSSTTGEPAENFIFGGIPERPKGADCKSVVTDFGGPNPPSPTNKETPFVYQKAFLCLSKPQAWYIITRARTRVYIISP